MSVEVLNPLKVDVLKLPVRGAMEIVSLTTAANGHVYGGTTGYRKHLLFSYNVATGKVQDLGHHVVSAAAILDKRGREHTQKIHHALYGCADGTLVGGTGQNVSVSMADFCTSADEGGHVFVYNPATGESRDYGIPVPNEWIINLTVNEKTRTAYGMTYPLNRFFCVDLDSGKMRIIGQVRGKIGCDSGCCHEMVVDTQGRVFGSCRGGYFFYYDPALDKLVETDLRLPGGDERIDSLIRHPDGLLYGGTWESGHLFSLDTRTMELTDFGSVLGGPRLPALALAKDGTIYGAAGGGAQYNTKRATLFRFTPPQGPIEIMGEIVAENGVAASRIHSMTMGPDGKLYAGETGSEEIEAGETGLQPNLFIISPN
ncbi:MAG: hypothetical protein WD042_13460 [Phycisphaeraceae bacterium]